MSETKRVVATIEVAGRTLDVTERHAALFWAKVDKQDPCWIWTGANDGKQGYGCVSIGSRDHVRAHRLSYALAHGTVPPHLQLDHLCRNPPCVNPDHLEPVTAGENTRRGVANHRRVAKRRAATTCSRGHLFDVANTMWDSNGWRRCRTCTNYGKRVRWHGGTVTRGAAA